MHIENMHSMIEDLTSCTKSAIESNKTHVGQYPISEVVDMIKDLSEAEYYAKISKAMDKAEEEEKDEEKYMLQRMKEDYGEEDAQRYYNAWRYADGRFAPKGRGTRRNYHMTPEMYRKYPAEWYRDMDREDGMMYYTSTGSNMGNMPSGDSRNYSDGYSDGNRKGYDEGYNKGYSEGQMNNRRDMREGRSGQRRRSYMETKEMHRDNTPESKQANMKELELYMNELSGDITDMIKDASQEERNMLKNKMQVLVQKLG